MQTNFPTSQIKHAFVLEMIGTAILSMVFNLASGNGVFYLPAVCFCVLSLILMLGNKSGGHLNPAVTLAQLLGYAGTPVFWRKSLFALAMMAGQFIGSAIGVCIVFWLSMPNEDELTISPRPALLCPHPNFSKDGDLCAVKPGAHLRIFFAEAIFTGIYLSTVMSIMYHKSLDFTAAAIVVVFSLFGNVNGAMQVSGACINPAIGISQLVFQNMIVPSYPKTFSGEGNVHAFTSGYEPLFAYVMGPFAGSVLATFYKFYEFQIETSSPDPDNHPLLKTYP